MTEPTVGHNSDPDARLEEFVGRIEALDTDRRALGQDMRDVLAEAKAIGLNPKIVRAAAKLRFESRDQVAKREAFEQELCWVRKLLGDILD